LKRAFKEASKDARHLLQEALDELATRGSDDLKDWAIELEELVGSEEQQDTEKA
jgi:hypothetical protein